MTRPLEIKIAGEVPKSHFPIKVRYGGPKSTEIEIVKTASYLKPHKAFVILEINCNE